MLVQPGRGRRRGSAGRCGSAPWGCAPAARCAAPRRRAVAAQLGEVGEQVEQLDLAGRARRARRESSSRAAEVARRAPRRRSSRVDVVAEQDRAEVVEAARGALPAAEPAVALRQLEVAASGPAASASSPASSATGSRRSSGAPVSTWLPVFTRQLAHPAGERRAQHRLHLHALQHQHRAPAATRSPTATGVATTRAGAGERSTPPSSRVTRWVTPSTSTRWTGPWVAVTSR